MGVAVVEVVLAGEVVLGAAVVAMLLAGSAMFRDPLSRVTLKSPTFPEWLHDEDDEEEDDDHIHVDKPVPVWAYKSVICIFQIHHYLI